MVDQPLNAIDEPVDVFFELKIGVDADGPRASLTQHESTFGKSLKAEQLADLFATGIGVIYQAAMTLGSEGNVPLVDLVQREVRHAMKNHHISIRDGLGNITERTMREDPEAEQDNIAEAERAVRDKLEGFNTFYNMLIGRHQQGPLALIVPTVRVKSGETVVFTHDLVGMIASSILALEEYAKAIEQRRGEPVLDRVAEYVLRQRNSPSGYTVTHYEGEDVEIQSPPGPGEEDSGTPD